MYYIWKKSFELQKKRIKQNAEYLYKNEAKI